MHSAQFCRPLFHLSVFVIFNRIIVVPWITSICMAPVSGRETQMRLFSLTFTAGRIVFKYIIQRQRQYRDYTASNKQSCPPLLETVGLDVFHSNLMDVFLFNVSASRNIGPSTQYASAVILFRH
jgi:hypothetical protein